MIHFIHFRYIFLPHCFLSLLSKLTFAMSGTQDFVASITLAKESWDIVVRVVRLWFVPDNYANQKFFAMKMVLMDEKVCF